MFEEIINKLLGLKENLQTEKEQRIAAATQEIENEFAENGAKIDKMLDECGYVAPVCNDAEPVCNDAVECETLNNEVVL